MTHIVLHYRVWSEEPCCLVHELFPEPFLIFLPSTLTILSSFFLCSSVTASGSSAPAAAADDDDEVDLFGSDEDEEEDEENKRIKAERVAEYEKKKAAKGPRAAAKSVVTFDVKPWDDETDMKALEESVRAIVKDGLVWGSSKLVPVGYGVKKLQITIVIEDDKISLDDLQEEVQEIEDYVQSTDIAGESKEDVLRSRSASP